MVMEFFMTLPQLRTGRLRLRAATGSDFEALWMLWNVPEVRRYLFDDRPVTRRQAAAILESALALALRGVGLWVVERVADRGTMVGSVALMPANFVADFDPGVKGLTEPMACLSPVVWGRGYAREALRAVIGYAFDKLRLPLLAAASDVPNEASHRMLCDLGFAVARECPGPCYPMRTYRLDAAAFGAAETNKLLSPARGRRATCR